MLKITRVNEYINEMKAEIIREISSPLPDISQIQSILNKYPDMTKESVHKDDVENVIQLIYESLQKIKNNKDFRYLK